MTSIPDLNELSLQSGAGHLFLCDLFYELTPNLTQTVASHPQSLAEIRALIKTGYGEELHF